MHVSIKRNYINVYNVESKGKDTVDNSCNEPGSAEVKLCRSFTECLCGSPVI